MQVQEQNNRSHLNWERGNIYICQFQTLSGETLIQPSLCLSTHTHTHTHTHHIYPLGKIRPPLNMIATLSSNRPHTKITVKPVEIKPRETEILERELQDESVFYTT